MKPPVRSWLSSSGAKTLGKKGFHKWYERQLLSSHAHMVLALLSVVAMLASVEAFRDASRQDRLMDVAFVIICAAVGLWALRRYLFLMLQAEQVARQATCGDCGEYGRFRVIDSHQTPEGVQVCCRKCQHQWLIQG